MDLTTLNQLSDKIKSANAGSVEKPTLFYFNIHGIVWPIRCLLNIKKVDFDDILIPPEMWMYRTEDGHQPLKDACTAKHLPLYADSDVVITQSLTMMQLLAEKHGMMGSNAAERIQVLEIMGQCHDALFHWCGLFPNIIKVGVAPETFEQRMQAFMGKGAWALTTRGHAINLLGFENYLKRNKSDSGFMVGNSLTYADLHAFNTLCNWYKAFNTEAFMAYPLLDAYIQRIAKIPEVASYIDSSRGFSTWLPWPQVASNLTSAKELEGLINA